MPISHHQYYYRVKIDISVNLISGHCGLFFGIPLKAWGAKLIEP